MKTCPVCALDKPLFDYHRDMRLETQYRKICKECTNSKKRKSGVKTNSVKQQKWRALNRTKNSIQNVKLPTGVSCLICHDDINIHNISYQLHSAKGYRDICRICRKIKAGKYLNFSKKDYIDLFNNQKGTCLICDSKFLDMSDKRVCIDHNHQTNQIRGLLCRECNLLVGMYEKYKPKLENLVKYLKRCKK